MHLITWNKNALISIVLWPPLLIDDYNRLETYTPYGGSLIYKVHQHGGIRKIYLSSVFEPWIFIVNTFKHKQGKGKLSIAGYMIISDVRKMKRCGINSSTARWFKLFSEAVTRTSCWQTSTRNCCTSGLAFLYQQLVFTFK